MKETTLNGYRILFVDVPEDTTEFNVFNPQQAGRQFDFLQYKRNGFFDNPVKLPPGGWQLMGPGLASEVTEEDVPEGMVRSRKHPLFYKTAYLDYSVSRPVSWLNSRSASLLSYVRAQGMEPERTVILIDKKK